MFMQVIRAQVADEAGVRKAFDEWMAELQSGATGYLGTTAGFLGDGWMIATARFDSEESAQRNSARPEQAEWAAELRQSLASDPLYIDVPDAHLWLGGGSDDAGFVQIMIGHSPDVQALFALSEQATERLQEARPEIIGGVEGAYSDNDYVSVVYFRSEQEARSGESLEPPEDVKEMVDEFTRLAGEVAYYDLHEPLLFSPRPSA